MAILDPTTMFLALVASTLAAVLLLVWTYSVNRDERSLIFVALGFLCVSLANLLFAGRHALPELVSIYGSGTLLALGSGLVWVAARVFNGKPVPVYVPLIGAGLWLTACQFTAFQESFGIRAAVASAIQAAYIFAGAREFLVRDGLRTRYALAAALAIHAAVIVVRAPLILVARSNDLNVFANEWFVPIALEGIIFVQILAFLMVSLTKERLESRLRLAAFTDPLTGLGNRRAFFEASQPIVADGLRSGRPSATIVFDLDRFKEINDRYGHPVGDAVLQTFGATAKRFLRPGDFAGRLGGEEFAITLPDTAMDHACQVAERIARAFQEAVAAMSDETLRCTASAGVITSDGNLRTLDQLLAAADRALYEAKDLGGGLVRRGELSDSPISGRAA